LLATVLALNSACRDTTCRGEIVDGTCVEACVDSRCKDGARCVDNRCTATCREDDDCQLGVCKGRRADDGDRISVCEIDSDTPPEPVDGEPALGCRDNDDCASTRAEHCVDGVCRVTCLLHSHCGPAGTCSEDAVDDEGQDVLLCAADAFPRGPGEYGTACPRGNVDCSGEFRCIGAGEGDADAYCTGLGCDADGDCPAGMFCSHNLSGNPPCADACGLSGDPTDPACIPTDAIGDGRPYRCADGLLELRVCLERQYCNDCETDADCRSVPGQLCARGSDGAKMCTIPCAPGFLSCPWGTASSCALWDESVGVPTCGHRAGSCHGAGNSCEPCIDDRDCPRGFCSANTFTSERFCVDEAATCECPSGALTCLGGGCPETPGGLTMNCVPRAEDAAPDACYGAPTIQSDETSALGCWPP
jgi:hypothetical protein